jgi:hypothetical protein
MRVFALVGPSGTGKSASALSFAHSQRIPALIDDGLLVCNGKKAAGISAKYDKNYITAIKRAVFYYEDHRKEVHNTIKKLKIESILILGTSIRMVDKIADKLELGRISKYYSIEEVRSSSQIKLALYMRRTAGKHVIPVPYVQLAHRMFERVLMRGKKVFSRHNEIIGETSIIRPHFHNGTINIWSVVIKDLIIRSCTSVENVKECYKVKFTLEDLPTIHASITVTYSLDSANHLFQIAEHVQKKILKDLLQYLEIEFYSINIGIDRVLI